MSVLQKMMAMAGRSPSGKARALKTDEDGVLETKLTGSIVEEGSNAEISSGVLNATTSSVEIQAIDGIKNVMIALNPRNFAENMSYRLVLEHYIPNLGWFPWYGGDGTPVEILYDSTSPAVFGPYQGFPAFDKGRIRILGADGEESITYNGFLGATVIDVAGTGLRPHEVTDGNIETSYSNTTGVRPLNLDIDAGKPVNPKVLTMYGRDGSSTVQTFELWGRKEDSTYDTLLSATLLNNATTQSWPISSPNKYRHYRLHIKTNGHNDLRVHEVGLLVPAEGDIDVSVWAVR